MPGEGPRPAGPPGPGPDAGPGGPPGPGGPSPDGPPGPPGGPPGMDGPPGPPVDEDPLGHEPLSPRAPGGPVGPGGDVPTDVSIDAQTGEITITRGPVNVKVGKYDPDNPPDKVSHLPEKVQRQWVHIYNSAADEGDDEETAHKKAWGRIPDQYKKNKGKESVKTADWVGPEGEFATFMRGNPPSMEDAPELYYDTHDDPFAVATNRYKPPLYRVIAEVPDGKDARALAYTIQTYMNLPVEVDGNTLRIDDVQNVMGLIGELNWRGINAYAEGENLPDLFRGQKVAIVGDLPQFNHYAGYTFRPIEAILMDHDSSTGEFVLKNDIWGYFRANRGDFKGV